MNNNFKVSARVISQLGAELISSDEVAIFELVKNGFDAKSSLVEVVVNYWVSKQVIGEMQKPFLDFGLEKGFDQECPALLKNELLKRLLSFEEKPPEGYFELSSERVQHLVGKVKDSSNIDEILKHLGAINSIQINDTGQGMTKKVVEDHFLTIGTTHRLDELEDIKLNGGTETAPCGEKGIGRLSAMRLGRNFLMETNSPNSEEEVKLLVNWNDFLYHRKDVVENIPVILSSRPKGNTLSGTKITVTNLDSDWPKEKAEKLGSFHLAKFLDPFPDFFQDGFKGKKARSVILKWNGEIIETKQYFKHFLDVAPNFFACRLIFNSSDQCKMETHFSFGETRTQTRKEFQRSFTIADFSNLTADLLKEIGPFEFLLYHFPRNRLKSVPFYASRSEVKRWLDEWCGGLMVFRDGVRVLPFASPEDDWLGIDGKALRGRGFRVNRIQVVGCVRISRIANPCLIDQTNREGLVDNPAFRTFSSLISRHIVQNFVSALDEHLREENAEVEKVAIDLKNSVSSFEKELKAISKDLEDNDFGKAKENLKKLEENFREVYSLFPIIENALNEKEKKEIQILELAGTGMAAEAIAHDLEGLATKTLALLDDGSSQKFDPEFSRLMKHIRASFKAITTQLRQITPGVAKSRRRPSNFKIFSIIKDVASFFEKDLLDHSISLILPSENQDFQVKAVEGHIRLILDNLFRNSIFWLKETSKKYPDFKEPQIKIQLDPQGRALFLWDNGLGISLDDLEWIFEPFNTRREDGRGLGLFICRELALFNEIKIYVDKGNGENKWGRNNVFKMEFLEVQSK